MLLLLLLLLSRFSRVWLCATPETEAHQAPLSLGFSRQEHWVAISFSNAWKSKVKGKSLGHVWLFVTLWTAAYQAPPSVGFFRQECWSGVPLLSPLLLLSGYWQWYSQDTEGVHQTTKGPSCHPFTVMLTCSTPSLIPGNHSRNLVFVISRILCS